MLTYKMSCHDISMRELLLCFCISYLRRRGVENLPKFTVDVPESSPGSPEPGLLIILQACSLCHIYGSSHQPLGKPLCAVHHVMSSLWGREKKQRRTERDKQNKRELGNVWIGCTTRINPLKKFWRRKRTIFPIIVPNAVPVSLQSQSKQTRYF